MPSPIVVEVYSPQPRPQELAVLIAACTRAAAPNECITSDMRTAESPLGVAIVRREGERARIELGLRGSSSADWSTRDLVFQPADDELERYRAIGFAIGTLVARRVEPPAPLTEEARPAPEGAPRAAPAAPQAEPPAPDTDGRVDAEEQPPEARATRATWLDVVGGVGLGLVPGAPRAGAALRASSEVIPGGLFGTAETGYAQRTGDDALRVRWLSLALGIGHPLLPQARTLGVEGRLLLVIERLSLTAVDGDRTDGTSRWKPGISAAIDAYWKAAPPLGIVAGVVTHLDPQRTVVRTDGDQVGETPALGLGGFIGVRLELR